MTTTLTFTLPEEREAFMMSLHGPDAFSALQALDNHLRDWIKYGNSFVTPNGALEAVRSLVLELYPTIE